MSLLESLSRTLSCERELRRHPRSFKQVGELWEYVRLGDYRKKQVKDGRSLFAVNEASSKIREPRKKSPTLEKGRVRRKKVELRKRGVTILGTTVVPRAPEGTFSPCRQAPDEAISRQFKGDLREVSVHFGASVAFESIVNDGVVVVRNSSDPKKDGQFACCSRASIEHCDVTQFKLVELSDPGSYRSIKFGDHVWLQIYAGSGEPSWKNGSVVGAKVYEATSLPTASLDVAKVMEEEEPREHKKQLGQPCVVKATLPKGKDDFACSYHETRMRNARALTLGRWRLMPATKDLAEKAKKRNNVIHNLDHVYLEQDFFYVSRENHCEAPPLQKDCPKKINTVTSSSDIVIKDSTTTEDSFGSSSSSSSQLTFHRIPPETQQNAGTYRVKRRGVFVLRVAEASTNLLEMSRKEQRSELARERARKCLALSAARRQGARRYRHDGSIIAPSSRDRIRVAGENGTTHLTQSPDPFPDSLDAIPGGSTFRLYLRESMKASFKDHELALLRPHVDKEDDPHTFFAEHFEKHDQKKFFGDTTYGPRPRQRRRSRSANESSIRFPPPSQQKNTLLLFSNVTEEESLFPYSKSSQVLTRSVVHSNSLFSSVTAAENAHENFFEVGSLATISPVQERKCRLLSAAAKKPLAFSDEDLIVAQQLSNDLRAGHYSIAVTTKDDEATLPLENIRDDDDLIGLLHKGETDLNVDDDEPSAATAKTIDRWHSRWMRKVAAPSRHKAIEKRLAATDDLIVNVRFPILLFLRLFFLEHSLRETTRELQRHAPQARHRRRDRQSHSRVMAHRRAPTMHRSKTSRKRRRPRRDTERR